MSFVSAEDSFFLDAVASTHPQPIIQIVPLNDEDIFDYLDAHPDVLVRYLRERPGILGGFSTTLAQGVDGPDEAASENEAVTTADQAVFDESFDDSDEAFWQPVLDAEQAVNEWDGFDDYECEFAAFDNEVDNEVDDEVDDEVSPEVGPEEPSDDNTAGNNDDSNDGLPQTNNNHGRDDFIPYPAPAHMIAESMRQPRARSWALWEEDACIKHMLDVHAEKQLKGEARFREALRRMQVYNNINRTGYSAVKNFWNRTGRARSSFDERRNKTAPLATSKQGSRARSSRTTSANASSSPAPITGANALMLQKRKTTNSRSNTNTNRRVRSRTQESEDEEEEEFDHFLQSDNEEPSHLRNSRKRKDRDDDSDEDEWQPNTSYTNAVTKGSRAPKRTREAAAY